jgi:polar amino acid transport system substrate-binding protein
MAGLVLLFTAACDFPRDAEGTLERVQGGELRVGVSENPPWVQLAGGRVEGIEPALVRGFAEQLGARIRWIRGTEAELIEALHRRELDLVAAGLKDNTPWSSRLGLSRPYLTTRVRIGIRPGGRVPSDWTGARVAVDTDRPRLAALVRAQGAEPVPAEGKEPIAIARYDFELEAAGLQAADLELAREKHVLAAPPGESAFLYALDRYLKDRGEEAMRRFAAEAAP